MSNTMLQLIQQGASELGVGIPAVVAGSTAADTIQALALLNAVGYGVVRQHPWQSLTTQYLFTTTSTTVVGDTTSGSQTIQNIASTAGLSSAYQVSGIGINQGTFIVSVTSNTVVLNQAATANGTGVTFTMGKIKYSLPSDYDRQIDRTHWDKTKHWEMLGPESPQQWENLQSGYISTGPRIRYRLLGNKFQIWPMVTTGDVLGFEYISNAWAADSGGTAKTSFTADNDTCIFPDRLMVLGLKKKYFEIKGFDSSQFDHDFQMELDISKAADAGSPTLAMAPTISNILINWTQIPDSNYGT